MKRSRLVKGSSSVNKKRLASVTLNDNSKIYKMIEGKEHMGTHVIEGGVGYSSKTFNLYKLNGKFIVTNHYGTELINATVYPDKKSVDKTFEGLTWTKYSMPMLPR